MLLIPGVARAATIRTEQLAISGSTPATDSLEAEGWKWEPNAEATSGTLTLRDAHFRVATQSADHRQSVIWFGDGISDATIVFEGTNIIESTNASDSVTLISGAGLTFAGAQDATLALNVPQANCNQLAFAIFSAPGPATFASGSITTNAQLLFADGPVTISGGSIICDASRIPLSDGIYNDRGPVTISGGAVDITAQHAAIFIPAVNVSADPDNLRTSITGGDVSLKAVGPSLSFGVVSRHIEIDTAGDLSIYGFDAPLCVYDPDENGRPAGSLSVKKTGMPIELSKSDESPYGYGDYCSYQDSTVISLADADYASVTAAQAAAAQIDRSLYTAESLEGLDAALAAVVGEKSVLEQDEVNAMAARIDSALASLVYLPADYSDVDTALAKVPGDLSGYTAESAAALEKAVEAVVRGLDTTRQADVDAMADAIETAIATLEKIPEPEPNPEPQPDPNPDPKPEEKPAEKDELPAAGDATVLLAPALGLAGAGALLVRRRLS